MTSPGEQWRMISIRKPPVKVREKCQSEIEWESQNRRSDPFFSINLGPPRRSINMVEFYKRFYCRLYSWNLRTWGESDVPEYNAVFGLSALGVVNLYNLMFLVNYAIGFDLFSKFSWSVGHAIGAFTILVLINYFIFIRNQQFKSMTVEFKKLSEEAGRRHSVLSLFFTAVSLLLFFSFILFGERV